MKSWNVYRCYNEASEIIYVGISSNLADRLRHQKWEKTWWKEVTRITREKCCSEKAAKEAERSELFKSRPRYNRYLGKTFDRKAYDKEYRQKNRERFRLYQQRRIIRANLELEKTLPEHQPTPPADNTKRH